MSKDSAFIYYKKSSFDRRQQCDVGLCPVCGNSQTKEKQPPTQINQGAYSKSHIIIKCQSFEIHPLVSNVRMKSPLSASTRMSSLSIRVWNKQQFSVVFQLSHVAHSGSSSTVRYRYHLRNTFALHLSSVLTHTDSFHSYSPFTNSWDYIKPWLFGLLADDQSRSRWTPSVPGNSCDFIKIK